MSKEPMMALSTPESVKKWCLETLNHCSSEILDRLATNITREDIDWEVLSLLCDDGEKEFTDILFGSNKCIKRNESFRKSMNHSQSIADQLAPMTLFRKTWRLKLGGV